MDAIRAERRGRFHAGTAVGRDRADPLSTDESAAGALLGATR